MISITRRHARLLTTVFRHSVLGLRQRGPAPPLLLKAEGSQLRAQYRYAGLAVEHIDRGSYKPAVTTAVPIDALAQAAGPDDSPVVFEAAQPDQTIVRWEDRGIPQSRSYPVPELKTLAEHPAVPKTWQPADPELWDALARAIAIATEHSTRYALDCIQLRGKTGQLVATDGHQLLVQQGFRLSWQEDLLVRRTPLLGCHRLADAGPLHVGKTPTHLLLRKGGWTIWLEPQTDLRFPDVERVIPSPGAVRCRLQLHDEDAQFLHGALDRLPGANTDDAPVTMDLNGRIAVQAQAEPGPRATELVLVRSRYAGEPIRLATNRRFLIRAVEWGFHELEFVGPADAVCGRSGKRVYAWQPLSESALIARPEHPLRIESTSATSQQARQRRARTAGPPPNGSDQTAVPKRHGRPHQQPDSQPAASRPGGFASLVEETQSLRTALRAARACTSRLLEALRFERRRSRQVESTLATLRQIRLPEMEK